MPILTHEQFAKSIYYPAARTDLQAILRFSHLADRFVCPTVEHGLTADAVQTSMERKLELLNRWNGSEMLELVDTRDFECQDLEYGPYPVPEDIFDPESEEWNDYQQTIAVLGRKPLWGREFIFRRSFGQHLSREIRWLAFTGDGLASYVALSRGGQFTPQLVCTIQSGLMEESEGIMSRMFRSLDSWPKIWVRGSWTERQRPAGLYSHVAQSFGYWDSRLGEPRQDNVENPHLHGYSLIKAFCRPDARVESNPDVTIDSSHDGRVVRLLERELTPGDLGNFDCIFTSERVVERLRRAGAVMPEDSIILWESLDTRDPADFDATLPPLTLTKAVREVERTCNERGFRKALMTPIGFEDESQVLREFSNREGISLNLEVRFHYDLDFVDLRGFRE